jgi:hypothetical protein
MALGTVNAGMAFDADSFISGMDKSIKKMEEMAKVMDGMKPPEPSRWEKFTKQVTDLSHALNVMDNLSSLASGLKEYGAAAINLASDFNETTNVMEQAFGRQTAAMETWSAATAEGLGRSTQFVRNTVGTFQAMLEPMAGSSEAAMTMAKSFTQLGVDLGSFWNVADSDAMAALRSGISGEAEPLKKFGIVMNEASLQAYALKNGIKAKVSEMEEAEKVQLRYNFIVDNTTKAHGDAARTADGYANATKALAADIETNARAVGQQALPAWQDLLVTFRNMLAVMEGPDWSGLFNGIASGIKTAADMFLSAAEATLTFAGALDMAFGGANEDKIARMTLQVMKLRGALAGDVAAPSMPGAANIKLLPTGQGFGSRGKASKDATAAAKQATSLEAAQRKAMSLAQIKALEEGYQAAQKNIAAARAAKQQVTDDWASLISSGSLSDMMEKGLRLSSPALTEAASGLLKSMAAKVNMSGALSGMEKMTGMDAGKVMRDVFDRIAPGVQSAFEGLVTKIGGTVTSVVSGVAGMVVDAVQSLIETVIASIKDIVSGTLGKLGTTATSGNRALESFGAGGAAAAGHIAIAGPAGFLSAGPLAATTALLDLSTQTKSYTQWQKALTAATQPLVQAMEPLWQQLLPLTSVFYQVNFALAQFLGQLIPGQAVARGLFDAVKFTSIGILHAALNIGRMINDLGGSVDTRAIAGSLHNLEAMTYQSAMAAAALQDLSDAARSSMNVPDVARISYSRYLAMRDENGAMDAGAAGLNRSADDGARVVVHGDLIIMGSNKDADEAIRNGYYKVGGNITSPRANLYSTG